MGPVELEPTVRKHTLHATPQHAFLVSRSKPKFNALKAQRWCQKLLLPYCWCLACLPASGSPWGGLPRKPLMSSQFRKIPDSIGADCLPCRTLTMRDQDTGILTTTPKDTGGSSTDMAAKNSTSILFSSLWRDISNVLRLRRKNSFSYSSHFILL